MMRCLVAAVLVLGVVTGCGSATVPAPDCPNPADPAVMIQYAPTILVVEVLETREDGIEATVVVKEKWRGVTLPEEVVVRGDGDPEQPVRQYAVGVDYLLFSDEVFSPLPDHGCSATREFTEELAALRPERAISYGIVRDANLVPWLIGGGSVLALGVGLGVWRASRDRKASGAGDWNPAYEIGRDEDGFDT
ncbi:MAG: hypothetical protein HKN01_01895 [Acidimicrobiia bacterium]|nr:hypothetical protein [Acidimicrobiia bacterium]